MSTGVYGCPITEAPELAVKAVSGLVSHTVLLASGQGGTEPEGKVGKVRIDAAARC